MKLRDVFSISLDAIRGNRTRAVITGLIISIGIMALVGILTAIDGIESSISTNFSEMGANTFNIKNRGNSVQFGGRRKAFKRFDNITLNEALTFKEDFEQMGNKVSLSINASFNSTIKYLSNKTEPNVMVMGGDNQYLDVSGYSLEIGRNFSLTEGAMQSAVAIIGKEIKTKLFKKEDAIGKFILVGGARFKIIGVLKEKGASMGFGGDRIVIVPIESARSTFSRPNMSFVITVAVDNVGIMEQVVEDATVLFRKVRRLSVSDDNNFEIVKADNISKELINMLSYVTIAATVIGFITLVGAAVGLMNIMLVSVTERTREIGVRKAIGANKRVILSQFLMEAILICVMGGLGGIFLGILIGNIVSVFVGSGFIIPWNWMGAGLLLCIITGIVSGIYPAIKATRLDPIEALRYE